MEQTMRTSNPLDGRFIFLALFFFLRPTFCSGEDEASADEAFCERLPSKYSCGRYEGCEWRNDTCVDLSPERIEIGQEYPLGPLEEKGGRDIPSTWRVDGPLGDKKDKTYVFVVIPNCLDASDADKILSLRPQMNEKTQIKDRQDYVEHNHVVHRVEPMLKQQHGMLYEKLVSTMIDVDAHIWRKTQHVDAVFPEIEFIDYQTSKGQGFGAHVDNGSLITAVFMTSDPTKDFEGGSLIFDDLDGEDRAVNLNFAECVVFRGNQLEHRVSPITKGRRMILQIELSHTHNDDEDSSSDDDMDDSGDSEDYSYDEDDYDDDDDTRDGDEGENSRDDGKENDSPQIMEAEL